MIIYFADRSLNILGLAGDKVKRGYNIENDEREISVDTAVATFSFDISYNDANRAEVEKLTYAGNYILRYNDSEKECECYTIIDTDQNTESKNINVYAEDVGLDLINDVNLPFNYETANYEDNVDHAADGNATNKGYINESGAYIADANYRATNHMGLGSSPPEAWLFEVQKSAIGSRRYSVAFYDANRSFISGSGKYYYFTDSSQVSRVETPSNAKYVRISFHKDCTSVYFMASSVKSYDVEYYINRCVSNSGFEIGLNEIGNAKYPIEFEDTQTSSERVLDIIKYFDADVSYSFAFSGLRITRKMINILKRRGADNKVTLRLGNEVKNIRITRSVAELGTAILAIGNTVDNDGNEKTFTLERYNGTVENGYYIEGNKLCSSKAYSKWSRFLSESGRRSGHIVKQYDYDCDSQETLYRYALKDLKAIEDASVEYEVELYSLPASVMLGDTLYVVDDLGEVYISARVLSIRRSVTNDTINVTLGEFSTKSSGLADSWALFKQQFAVWTEKNRTRYIWVAYADDNQGTGISLDPTNKNWMGIADNQKVEAVDLSDPSIFNWIQLVAKDGIGVRSTTVSYGVTNNPNVMPGTNDWSSDIPTVNKGQVLWTRIITDYTDDNVPDTVSYTYSIQGQDGERGYSVTVTSIKYISWASATVTPPNDDSLWSNTPVVVPQGNYLWTKTTFSDGTIAYGVARQGEDGQQGIPGTSPIIEVEKEGGTATITITDVEGTKTITVEDGDQGEQGVSIISKQDYYMIADKGDTLEGAMVYEVISDKGDTITLVNQVARPVENFVLILNPVQNGGQGPFTKWNDKDIEIYKAYEEGGNADTMVYTYHFSTIPNPDYVESETPETIDLPDFHAGVFDLKNGILKTNTEYLSYNGEELNGRWVSSMDVYQEGHLPTIGAHVIDLEGFSNEYAIPQNETLGVITNPLIDRLTENDRSFSLTDSNAVLDISYWIGTPVAEYSWSTEPRLTNKFSNYLWWYYVEVYSDGATYTSTPSVINSIDSRIVEVEESSRAQYLQTSNEIALVSTRQNELVITQEQLSGDITRNQTAISTLESKLSIKDGEISALTSSIDQLNNQLTWARAYLSEKGLNVADSENPNTKTLVTGDGINITDPNDDTIIYLNVNSTNSTIHNTTVTGYANIGGASFSRKQETEYDGTTSYGVAIYN